MAQFPGVVAVVVAVAVGLTGCGGKSDPPPAEVCTVASGLGDLGMVSGQASLPDPAYLNWVGLLNADVKPNAITVEFYAGYGVFAGGIASGTYSINGDELQYATCGLCVLVYGDVDTVGGTPPGAIYMATGGQVDVTSVVGNLTLSLSNVTFHKITIDPVTFVSTPVGACTTQVTSLTVNDPIL